MESLGLRSLTKQTIAKDFLFVQISNDGINWTTIGDKFKVPEKRRYKGLNFEYIRAVKMNGAAWATMTVYG